MGNSVMLNGVEYAGEQIAYKDSTYELVSKVAYLIGVPLRIFQNEHEPPKIEIYDRLEQDKNARIIRNLCIIRTAIERNYRRINDIMRMEYRGLLSMPEIIPASSMQQLSNDGISFIKKSSTKLCHHIIEINRLISDRINNCKSLFPIWINWAYIKELFIMPNGLTEDGTKDAADIYYASLSYHPKHSNIFIFEYFKNIFQQININYKNILMHIYFILCISLIHCSIIARSH